MQAFLLAHIKLFEALTGVVVVYVCVYSFNVAKTIICTDLLRLIMVLPL